MLLSCSHLERSFDIAHLEHSFTRACLVDAGDREGGSARVPRQRSFEDQEPHVKRCLHPGAGALSPGPRTPGWPLYLEDVSLPPPLPPGPASNPGNQGWRSSLTHHHWAFPIRTAAAPGPGGTMLSMTYSESLRSVSSRCHSDWALHPVRQTDTLELQRLREVRAAAQARNMESFLRMHGLSLEGCTARRTGMKYR